MPSANDIGFANDAASLMMCPAGHKGKHRIIVSGANNIISEQSDETSLADKVGGIIDSSASFLTNYIDEETYKT